MEHSEQEKSGAFNILEIVDYVPNAIVIKTIMKRPTGSISVVSFDSGKVLPDRISAFDILIQAIEGKADIIIDHATVILSSGQSIIIPAHAHNSIKAGERFKMISSTIKSGYE